MSTRFADVLSFKRLMCLFVSFVLGLFLIPTASFGVISAFADEASMTARAKVDDSVLKVTSSWVQGLVGRCGDITWEFNPEAVHFQPTSYDILYLIDFSQVDIPNDFDGDGVKYYEDSINNSIERIKAQNSNSRFSIIGFCNEGILNTGDFKSSLQAANFRFGTKANYSEAFKLAKQRIDSRSDKTRKVQVVYVGSSPAYLADTATAFNNLNNAVDDFIVTGRRYNSYGINSQEDSRLSIPANYISESYAYSQFDGLDGLLYNFDVSRNSYRLEDLKFYDVEKNDYYNSSFFNDSSIMFYSGGKYIIDDKVVLNERATSRVKISNETIVTYKVNGTEYSYKVEPTYLDVKLLHVKYDINGGTGMDVPEDNKTYYEGDTVYLKQGSLLSKGKNTFGGWEPDVSDLTAVGTSGMQYKMGNSDVTFTAQYGSSYVHADYKAIPTPRTKIAKPEDGHLFKYGLYPIDLQGDIHILTFSNTFDLNSNIGLIDESLVGSADDYLVDSWDMAEDGSDGVKAFVFKCPHQPTYKEETYDVVIASDGVYPSFPDNSYHLFERSLRGTWNFDNWPVVYNFDKIDTSNVTDMSYMFEEARCLSGGWQGMVNWDTSSVTNMEGMFDYVDRRFKTFPRVNWDTSNVTNMSSMFTWCNVLESVDLSQFNTSNVEDLSGMFDECFKLTKLDLSSFDTRKVTDMGGMFSNMHTEQDDEDLGIVARLSGLSVLDLGSFDTSNVKDFSGMFENAFNPYAGLDADSKQCILYYRTDKDLENYKRLGGLPDYVRCIKRPKTPKYSTALQNAITDSLYTPVVVNEADYLSKPLEAETLDNTSNLTDSDATDDSNTFDDSTNNKENDTSLEKDGSIGENDSGNSSEMDSGNEVVRAFSSVAYADDSFQDDGVATIPDAYKDTVNAGKIEAAPANISFSLDAMYFAYGGQSGTISVSAKIPDGMEFIDNSFKYNNIAMKIDDPDGMSAAGSMIETPTYDPDTRRVSFKVNSLAGNSYWRVNFKCSLDSIPRHHTTYVLNADYETSSGVASTSNNVVYTAGEETETLYSAVYEQTGEVPLTAPDLPATLQYTENEMVRLAGVPSALGYSATDWVVTADDGTNIPVADDMFEMPAQNVKISTTWTKDPERLNYKLKFSLSGVEGVDYPSNIKDYLPDEDSILEGSLVYAPTFDSSDFDGWVFDGWFCNGVDVSSVDGSFVMPAKDVELVGKWSKDKYKIIFSEGSSGPSSGISLPDEMEVAWGETVNWPSNATYSGDETWTFLGWSNDAEIRLGDTFVMPKSNVTFTANWINELVYMIKVHDGVASPSISLPGNRVEIATDLPKNKVFDGWNVLTGDANLDDIHAEKTSFIMPAADVEIAALNHEITTYTVHFDANGGIGVMQDITCEVGQNTTLPANAFYRDNCIFNNWNKNSDGQGESFADCATIYNLGEAGDSITLYATWNSLVPGLNGYVGNDGSVVPLLARLLGLPKTGDPLALLFVTIVCVVLPVSIAISLRSRRNKR